jgi:hypothetical protein
MAGLMAIHSIGLYAAGLAAFLMMRRATAHDANTGGRRPTRCAKRARRPRGRLPRRGAAAM